MGALRLMLLAAAAGLIAAPAAQAHRPQTTEPGETPWWFAAQHDITAPTVAPSDAIAGDGGVVLGSASMVPAPAAGDAALARAGIGIQAPAAAATAAPPPPPRAYVVREGDTLSALAAPTALTAERLAWINGLDPAAILAIGTVLKLPADAPALTRSVDTTPAALIVPDAAPVPTAGTLSAERVKQLAVEQGAPGSLAAAIAWQESGFDNAAVSPANARGVMQVMPGTWDWVRANLAGAPLSPTSPEDNVRAGALYLARLLRDTGGDVRLATAAYYQGLWSVRSRGLFDDTRRYVDDVLALRARFGAL